MIQQMIIPPIALEPDETLLAEVYANLWRGWEAVGGKLFVTDRRIRFESHPLNVQCGATEILLSEVKAVSRCTNLGWLPNGLLVETTEARTHRFVVWNRQQLLGLIQMAMTKTQAHGSQAPDRLDATPPDLGVQDRELDGNN
jgi:GRAM domain